MGMPSMETAEGKAATSLIIFIGIAITQHSFDIGLASYRYWYPIMEAFRSINNQLAGPRLTQEILHMIQAYLRAEGDKIAQNTRRNFIISDHDLKFMERTFSLTIQDPQASADPHLYLAIPWDVFRKPSVSNWGGPRPGQCCHYVKTLVSGSVDAGYGSDQVERSRNTEAFIIDQDLRITEEKIRRINRALRELGLRVHNPPRGWTRLTECDASNFPADIRFKSTDPPKGQKLWMPRVILLEHTELALNEVEREEY